MGEERMREWENFRSEKEIVGENENMREWVNAGQPYEIQKEKSDGFVKSRNFSIFVIPAPAFAGVNLSPQKWGAGIQRVFRDRFL